MAETLAERKFTAAEIEELGATGRRAFEADVHRDMRSRGIPRDGYDLQCVQDPARDIITFRAVLIDPIDRPLRFDDRGIV